MFLVSIIRKIRKVYNKTAFIVGVRLRRIWNKYPVVVTDRIGIRRIVYPWNVLSVKKTEQDKTYEIEYQVLKKLLSPDSIVFDVGANTGMYAVLMSRLVAPKGCVYAFEPVPDTYWELKTNLSLNRCNNVETFQIAVSNSSGQVVMNLFPPEYSVWNTMGKSCMSTPMGEITPIRSIEVPSETLDNFCGIRNIHIVHFLKVDVEGFEKHVFLGAEKLLKEQRVNYIWFEISQEPLKGAGMSADDIFKEIERHGYIIYKYHERTHSFKGPIHASQEYFANYLAVSPNKETDLKHV